jgi:hypothetical protein
MRIDSETQLVISIPEEIHRDVKKRAIDRNMTLKAWAIQAFLEKIERENRANSKKEE